MWKTGQDENRRKKVAWAGVMVLIIEMVRSRRTRVKWRAGSLELTHKWDRPSEQAHGKEGTKSFRNWVDESIIF